MVAASIVNISLWAWTLKLRRTKFHSTNFNLPLLQPKNLIWLSGIYVLVCAFRSVLPRADVQRICLFDTWFSSVFLGRTLATLGELAFIGQWSLVLHRLGLELRDNKTQYLARVTIVLIAVAEFFSWYAVITTHYFGNFIEESLWALAYVLIGISLWRLSRKTFGALRLATYFGVLGSSLYVLFMATVDIPMYVRRLLLDTANHKPLLGLRDGIVDLNTRWTVTQSIADWKAEIPWQTLYFTFAVLVSIALCYVPLQTEELRKFNR